MTGCELGCCRGGLAIWDSLHTSCMEGWWCRASALAFTVNSKAKLNDFSSTATELGIVATSINYYLYSASIRSRTSSNLRKLKANVYW